MDQTWKLTEKELFDKFDAIQKMIEDLQKRYPEFSSLYEPTTSQEEPKLVIEPIFSYKIHASI